MADETDGVQLNLGPLRSAMSLTLHTHHASRIWHGRAQSEGRPGIMGLSGFVSIMSRVRRGAEQDDPYSDWWMLRIEDKVAETKQRLRLVREQVDQALADIPSALSVGDNLNVQPVKLPLFVSSPLGFSAVYLLADYDELARRLLLAHHTALIDRDTLEAWLHDGAHALRSLFSMAQQYRFSGTTRDDFASMNAAARAALEKFGPLPPDVLEGLRRSRFAPPVGRRPRPSAAASNIDLSDDAALDDLDPAEPDAKPRENDDTDDAAAPAPVMSADLPQSLPVTRRSRTTPSAARRSRRSPPASSVGADVDAPADDGESAETSADGASDESEDSAEASDDDEDDTR